MGVKVIRPVYLDEHLFRGIENDLSYMDSGWLQDLKMPDIHDEIVRTKQEIDRVGKIVSERENESYLNHFLEYVIKFNRLKDKYHPRCTDKCHGLTLLEKFYMETQQYDKLDNLPFK